MKEVGFFMVVRDFINISVVKVEFLFMFILILDFNSSKVSGLIIWRGDGRYLGKN